MKKKPKSKLIDNEKNRKLNHTIKPYTKCTKMSEEAAENLEVKNGISNGSVLSSKQHQPPHHQPQQQPFRMHQKSPEHQKSNEYQKQLQSSNNSNSNSNDNHVNGTKSSNVGGRLQFFKDGKFILELARSREGEKHGWISVPRKTFWPPTITANSSKTFSKHESSTSLSYSDDNSSVQSSPFWQRDHCWKQTQPRQNISVEMSFFFHKPAILLFSKESKDMMQLKRRRPQDKSFGVYKVIRAERGSKEPTNTDDSKDAVKIEINCSKDEKYDVIKENDPIELKHDTSKLPKRTKKLESILKTLSDRCLQASSPPYNKSNNGSTPSQNISNYSILSHLQQNNLSHNNLHQHVSPRKRILREFEKVSLEDSVMKRSKQKQSQQVAATTIQASIPNQRFLNNFSNGNEISTNHTQNVSAATVSTIASKQPPTPISRPISSYSITSLLGHNNNKKSGTDDSILDKNTLNSNSKDSAYPSHCQRYSKEYDCAQQRISLITPQSPIYTQADHKLKQSGDEKLKAHNSPGSNSIFASSSRVAAKTLNLSSSPEHHAFQKYRPSHDPSSSPSTPYNFHHSSTAVVTSSSSPNDGSLSRGRGTSTGTYKSSPKRCFASTVASSSSGLQETSPGSYKRGQSPQYKDNSRDSSLSPSAMHLAPSKSKGTSLHRQSPCFSLSSTDAKIGGMVKDENALNLTDLKPRAKNTLVRPTTPLSLHHPTASHGMYYMYPPGYMQQSVSSYYHSFYNPPVAYRTPMYMQYPTAAPAIYDENLNTTSSNPMINRLGYVPMTNPWNPIPLTTHSIDDGNLIDNKMKDESSTDLPLNLSKH